MAELSVALTYGNALFQAAGDVGKRDQILEEATELLEVLKRESDLLSFMNTPVVPVADKKKTLSAIFEGQICNELLNLLYIMIDKGRILHFPKVIQIYRDLLNQEEGFSYGKIYSVTPLSETQLSRFEEETGKLLRQNVKLDNETDPRLIGGVKILIDGKIIDASLRSRLEDLSDAII